MKIDTLRFSHILGSPVLNDLSPFFAQTAFVISHKHEAAATLLNVIWYLPVNSTVLIVTNCPPEQLPELEHELKAQLDPTRRVYLIHQKDERVAHFLEERAVNTILGHDGLVLNGKGEGMYVGSLLAALLEYPQWLVFYDADNFVPSALLEYTLAVGQLFWQQRPQYEEGALHQCESRQNIRICWPSKPTFAGGEQPENALGRCTREVSPILTLLAREWFNIADQTIISSNAGEQGFSMATLRQLHFSSGYSIETMQMIDLFYQAHRALLQGEQDQTLLYQYQAHSPHFHEKGDDSHIKQMISDSLSSFAYFEPYLPDSIKQELQRAYSELELEFRLPRLYPTLNELIYERSAYSSLSAYDFLLFKEHTALLEQEELCS